MLRVNEVSGSSLYSLEATSPFFPTPEMEPAVVSGSSFSWWEGLDGVEGGLECDGLSYDGVNSGFINSPYFPRPELEPAVV